MICSGRIIDAARLLLSALIWFVIPQERRLLRWKIFANSGTISGTACQVLSYQTNKNLNDLEIQSLNCQTLELLEQMPPDLETSSRSLLECQVHFSFSLIWSSNQAQPLVGLHRNRFDPRVRIAGLILLLLESNFMFDLQAVSICLRLLHHILTSLSVGIKPCDKIKLNSILLNFLLV